jgi:hypothetical protein
MLAADTVAQQDGRLDAENILRALRAVTKTAEGL